MKVEELMIGDWIIINPYKQVTLIKDAEQLFHISESLCKMNNIKTDEPYIEPIYITKSMLISNGFKISKPYEMVMHDTCYHIYYDIKNKILKIYTEHRPVMETYCECVHELQHIFKFYKIEKEINL